MSVFLVERYQPGLDQAEGERMVARLEAAAPAFGATVLGVTIMLTDEAWLARVAAASRSDVERLCQASGVGADRITEAIEAGAPSGPPAAPTGR